jgi:hypothetical protein
VAKIQPALCKRDTAGYNGPFLRPSSSKATPKYYPSKANAKVPLFIFRKTPKMPCLLKGFPYLGPIELELCLSYPTPKYAQPYS